MTSSNGSTSLKKPDDASSSSFEELKEALKTGIAEISWKGADGAVHKADATLCADFLPEKAGLATKFKIKHIKWYTSGIESDYSLPDEVAVELDSKTMALVASDFTLRRALAFEIERHFATQRDGVQDSYVMDFEHEQVEVGEQAAQDNAVEKFPPASSTAVYYDIGKGIYSSVSKSQLLGFKVRDNSIRDKDRCNGSCESCLSCKKLNGGPLLRAYVI